MGSAFGKIGSVASKFDPLRGGDRILESIGLPTLSGQGENNIFDMGQTAQLNAMRDAAEKQAAAIRQQSEQQAASARQAADLTTRQMRDSAQATAAAQQSSINQAAMASQLAAQAAAAPREGTPDVQLGGQSGVTDARRKYRGASASSIGGTSSSGGVSIRI